MNRMKAQAVTGSRDKVDKYESDGQIGVQHEIWGVRIDKIKRERKTHVWNKARTKTKKQVSQFLVV